MYLSFYFDKQSQHAKIHFAQSFLINQCVCNWKRIMFWFDGVFLTHCYRGRYIFPTSAEEGLYYE